MGTENLNFAILEYLTKLRESSEGIDVAIQCLSEAFGLDFNSNDDEKQYSYRPHTLESLFAAGVSSLKAKTIAEKNDEIKANPRFEPFLTKVSEKGYFTGCEEGSEEYNSRMQKLIDKFSQKLEAEAAVSAPEPTPKIDEALLAQADELKNKGNDALVKTKDYRLAIDYYTQAIDMYPDGPNTHIYYCNRAAARTHLEDFEGAIEDSQASVDLVPEYTKAWSRMGTAHFQMNQFEEAVEAFEKLLEYEPGNSYGEEMRDKSMRKLENQSNMKGGLGAGGMPDLSNLAGMLGGAGGAGGLAGLMNNPNIMQAAQQMMQNPQMMSMAQNMMKDPNAMKNMMSMLGGGGGAGGMEGLEGLMGAAGGGGVPSFGGFVDDDAPAEAPSQPAAAAGGMAGLENSPEMERLKNDPEMADFFRDLEAEGPMAAMKHMGNPKINKKIMSIMGSLMGGQS